MENRYRGYPLNRFETMEESCAKQKPEQTLAAPVQHAMEIKPYMIYDRETQSEVRDSWDERRRVQAEYEYFRGLYPLAVRNWQRFVEEELDQREGSESLIYDEYPDRENLYVMRERILHQGGEQGTMEVQDVVMVLLLHELLHRRNIRG